MPLVEYEHMAERRLLSRRGLVIFIAIVALTCSVARRVADVSLLFKAPTAVLSSSTAKIQHLDQDAAQWVAPEATFTLLRATQSSVIRDADESVPIRLQDNSLHNRPPPIS
jgi:hypothetical protein